MGVAISLASIDSCHASTLHAPDMLRTLRCDERRLTRQQRTAAGDAALVAEMQRILAGLPADAPVRAELQALCNVMAREADVLHRQLPRHIRMLKRHIQRGRGAPVPRSGSVLQKRQQRQWPPARGNWHHHHVLTAHR
jgi:hypothetical protein